MAQNDSVLAIGRDTIAYRYTPITNQSAKPRGERKGLSRFANYLADSATDQSFERKVDMTFVPTLYYSPSTSVGLALMASGRYRLDKRDRSIPASDFSVFATASLTGYYRVGAQGRNIFRGDNQRILYNAEFSSMPTKFWGVGYDAAITNGALRYLASRTIVDVRILQKVAKGLYLGVGADFNHHFGGFGGRRGFVAESDFVARLGGERVEYCATGVSLLAEFDTRDVSTNPQRGVYVGVQAKVRPKMMGNVGKTLLGGRLVFDYYRRLWRGAVLALDLRGEMNSEGTPWIYNATLGGVQTMRGYYFGRFNDLCAVALQAELRQNIYRRLGAVAWGGAGNVFRNFATFSWAETLPTYGVGLRYEVRKGINLRLDYGFGCRDTRGNRIHGALFSINEAF